jgi:hypothetical protein
MLEGAGPRGRAAGPMMLPSMLRRACDTAAMQDLIHRLTVAATDMEGLRPSVVAGEPWPLSAAYGAEPESDWGPKEVLAHVEEMLEYWPRQVDGILAAPPADGPPTFGRVATDETRIGRIGADRQLPADELFDRVAACARDVETRMAAIPPQDQARSGVHVRLGEMTIPAIFERFVVSHLEEHVRQLREVGARA